MMFIELMSFLAVATSPSPLVTGEFVGYNERHDNSTRWERFDLKLTNNSDEKQNLGVCPRDADMVLKTNQQSTRSAFAVKFNDDDWSFECNQRELAPGQSVTVGMFFRPAFEAGPQRYIAVNTTLGSFVIGK